MSSLSEHHFLFICKALGKKIGGLFDLINIMEDIFIGYIGKHCLFGFSLDFSCFLHNACRFLSWLNKDLDVYRFLWFGRSGGCGQDLHAVRTVECCK